MHLLLSKTAVPTQNSHLTIKELRTEIVLRVVTGESYALCPCPKIIADFYPLKMYWTVHKG